MYDLSGMSTTSFEHLVQALAVAVIGPHVSVFGAGRDGGREATFNGPAAHGSNVNWSGYGVIQAKCRERAQNSEEDGDWALRQLKAELATYDNPAKGRLLPEYYIFCTNVVLTPYPRLGGKDKVTAELEKWTESRGLKGWSIWDRDQIATYLDVHDGVRRTFAAWTTPGDVLSAIIDQLQGVKPDFSRLVKLYLQKELRRDLYANLQQAGHLNEEPVALPQVFVDLPVSDATHMKPGQEWVNLSQLPPTGFFIASAMAIADRPLAQDSDARESSGAIARQPRASRMVLLGGPGQGKTTVGQYLCQLYRAKILADTDPSLMDSQTREALRVLATAHSEGGRKMPTCKRLPLRVVLSDYAADLARNPDLSILAYIAKLLKGAHRRGGQSSTCSSSSDSVPFSACPGRSRRSTSE